MNKQNKTDVVVVGMGMAGLMAAYTAAKNGKNVTLLGSGLGTISIASGCIDVLGYVAENSGQATKMVKNPLTDLELLPKNHPYKIIGPRAVEQALLSIQSLCNEHAANQGFEFTANGQENTLVPTLMGTFKPTYIYPIASDSSALFKAKKILVASVDAIRDCHVQLIAKQLQKYPRLKDVEFSTTLLTSHFGKAHRAVSPLDVARYVDTAEGLKWLCNALRPLAKEVDAILLPPILGTKNATAWTTLKQSLVCPVVEMISLPPGVGGHRLFTLFMQALSNMKDRVRIIENATITHAEVQNGRCAALISHTEGVEHRFCATAYIIATGGILSGGILTKPGKAYESIFGIELETPEKQEDWAADNAFGAHAFTRMGVIVNEKLQPVDANMKPLFENVHFAGRSLGNYDFASEKSGNGVALATAWHAAQQVSHE